MKLRLLIIAFLGLFLLKPTQAFAEVNTRKLMISVGNQNILITRQDNKKINKQILVADHLSSTKQIINENGEIITQPIYYPYGTSTTSLNLDKTSRYYTNQRKVDDDTDVYNYNARYYNPDTSVFIQPDVQEGPTRYTYVSGNPIMANDPSGNDAIIISYPISIPGQQHVGALLQDKNDNWFYFYWGAKKRGIINDSAVLIELIPKEFESDEKTYHPLESLDDFNVWVRQFHGGFNAVYDDSTYIEGDFTNSINYAKELKRRSDRGIGKKYNLFFNNCMQVTCDVLEKGESLKAKITNNSELEDLIFRQSRHSMLTTIAIKNFKRAYGNNRFTNEIMSAQIKLFETLVQRQAEIKKKREIQTVLPADFRNFYDPL